MSSLQLFDLLLQNAPPYHVPIPSNDDPAADVLSRLQLFDRVPPTGSGGNISSQFLLMMSQRWSPSCLMISPEKFPQDAFSLWSRSGQGYFSHRHCQQDLHWRRHQFTKEQFWHFPQQQRPSYLLSLVHALTRSRPSVCQGEACLKATYKTLFCNLRCYKVSFSHLDSHLLQS